MTRRGFLIGLAVAVLIQATIIGAMLYERITTLINGQEVILESAFVDPRDLFRGHYVRLNLTAGRITNDVPGAQMKFAYNDPVFVTLKPGDTEFWVAKSLHKSFPQDTGDPVIEGIYRGRVTTEGSPLRLQFPFDRYFAPKKRAQELENLPRDQELGVVLALDGSGGGVIKGITVDGQKIYDEPLF